VWWAGKEGGGVRGLEPNVVVGDPEKKNVAGELVTQIAKRMAQNETPIKRNHFREKRTARTSGRFDL